MKRLLLCRVAALAAVLLQFPAAQTLAATLEVAPTTLELPAGRTSAQLRIYDHGASPADVQIEAFAWNQDGAETLGPCDIVLSPPLAHLEPGGSQIVRLLVPAPADGNERAYRIVVTQLPNPGANFRGTRILLQFSVPLFSGTGKMGGAALTWSLRRQGKDLILGLRNAGTRRAKLSNLELVAADGARLAVAGHALTYVLARAARSWRLTRRSDFVALEAIDEDARKPVTIPPGAAD